MAWLGTAGAVVAILGAIVMLRSLFGDGLGRRRRSRRCPRCWYDMEGSSGLTCPECGRTVKRERALLRRKWSLKGVLAGVLIMLAGVCGAAAPRVGDDVIAPLLPDWWLLSITSDPRPYSAYSRRWNPNPPSVYQVELWERYRTGKLSVASRRRIMDAQFSKAPPVDMQSRSVWPLETPLDVNVAWNIRAPLACEIEMTARLDDATRIVGYHPPVYSQPDRSFTMLARFAGVRSFTRWRAGTPTEETDEIVFDVVIRQGGEVVWKGVHEHSISVAGTIDDLLRKMTGEEAESALVDALVGRVGVDLGEPALIVELQETSGSTIPLAIHVDVLDGDEVLVSGSGEVTAYDQRPQARFVPLLIWPLTERIALEGNRERFVDAFESGRLLIVRVTPAPAIVLRDPEAETYWTFEIEFDLKELLAPDR